MFVAVLSKNDYPMAVSASFSTYEEADAVGQQMEASARHADRMSTNVFYHHFHYRVFPQQPRAERRKGERRDGARRQAYKPPDRRRYFDGGNGYSPPFDRRLTADEAFARCSGRKS